MSLNIVFFEIVKRQQKITTIVVAVNPGLSNKNTYGKDLVRIFSRCQEDAIETSDQIIAWIIGSLATSQKNRLIRFISANDSTDFVEFCKFVESNNESGMSMPEILSSKCIFFDLVAYYCGILQENDLQHLEYNLEELEKSVLDKYCHIDLELTKKMESKEKEAASEENYYRIYRTIFCYNLVVEQHKIRNRHQDVGNATNQNHTISKLPECFIS